MVEGVVRLSNGEGWSFSDPCLTTWEASSIAEWLRQVATGSAQPSAFPSEDDERLQIFTEPNLALSLETRVQGRVTIRVHISVQSLPPWLTADHDKDLFDYFVSLNVSEADLQGAIDDWASEIAAFPNR
nr:hypothetical protein [Rudaeicoccus suwonensis]